MSSTDRIDYNLRQNKSIERSIVFDGLRAIYDGPLSNSELAYVGFGSVWFSDFQMAHKSLGIANMISIESDPVTAIRASFNRPFRTIEVVLGDSSTVVPELLERPELRNYPWIVWLDFDQSLDADRLDQLDTLVRHVPDDSCVISTFSATRGQYGTPSNRLEYLRGLFGFAFPRDVERDAIIDDKTFGPLLARCVSDRLASIGIGAGRAGALSAFELCYQDGAPMVTAGVLLPSAESLSEAKKVLSRDAWCGIVPSPITIPPLTMREVDTLRKMLPSARPVTVSDVQDAGFDLAPDQLDAFVTHYTRYPTYAQLAL